MSTIESTPPVAPAWLNLDELCPLEVRDQIAALTDVFQKHAATLADDIVRARYLIKCVTASQAEAASHLEGVMTFPGDRREAAEGLRVLIEAFTGTDRLCDVLGGLSDDCNVDHIFLSIEAEEAQV